MFFTICTIFLMQIDYNSYKWLRGWFNLGEIYNLYLKQRLSTIVFGVIFKFVAAIMDLIIPAVLAYIIDTVVLRNSQTDIIEWGGIMVLCAALSSIFNIVANRNASKVARDATLELRHDLFNKVESLSARQIDAFTKPSLISRLTSDTSNIQNFISRIQKIGIKAPINLIGGIAITLTMDPVLTLILFATIPFIVLVTWYVQKKSQPLYTQLQEAMDRLVRQVREDISGIRVIKALSNIDKEREKYNEVSLEVANREKTASLVVASVNPVMSIIFNIGLVCVLIAGAYRVNSGAAEVGTVLAFITYFTMMTSSMMAITRIFTMFSKAGASAERVMDVMNSPSERVMDYSETTHKEDYIEFDNVSFAYDGKDNVLSHVSFRIKKGQTLGIIGGTGSGKSTIIALLLGFYQPQSGQIYLGGKDIDAMDVQELRSHFGVTFQNDTLFNDSIKNNIDIGRLLSDDQIALAVESAQAKQFVDEKENGLDELLAIKGGNLSGGQKQRILVARALAASPDIIVLDDSSSALDYKTDQLMRDALIKNYPDSTKIIIAQRASSMMSADKILVLDKGKEMGYGTHMELLESCPIYKEIADSQMGGDSFE